MNDELDRFAREAEIRKHGDEMLKSGEALRLPRWKVGALLDRLSGHDRRILGELRATVRHRLYWGYGLDLEDPIVVHTWTHAGEIFDELRDRLGDVDARHLWAVVLDPLPDDGEDDDATGA